MTIIFNPGELKNYEIFHKDFSDSAQEAAREWIVNKWVELECEPTRQSGKVLLLDRILSVADELGYYWFDEHPDQAEEFARQCSLALDSPVVIIDIPGASISSN
ncbi:hypothetical protein [Pelistega indica]|uniref:hypothetical protein n=1 Tax=Pelistega indica TaxID=1414851 RepID=UPI001FE01D19|nr:hypothetical protein [Pelistega indica]